VLSQSSSVQATLAQPGVQPCDLAVAHVQRAARAAGEAAVGADLAVGGDQVLEAEVRRGQLGEEAVGGGGQHGQVTGVEVALHQRV
jgi:hypothetical protein